PDREGPGEVGGLKNRYLDHVLGAQNVFGVFERELLDLGRRGACEEDQDRNRHESFRHHPSSRAAGVSHGLLQPSCQHSMGSQGVDDAVGGGRIFPSWKGASPADESFSMDRRALARPPAEEPSLACPPLVGSLLALL